MYLTFIPEYYNEIEKKKNHSPNAPTGPEMHSENNPRLKIDARFQVEKLFTDRKKNTTLSSKTNAFLGSHGVLKLYETYCKK